MILSHERAQIKPSRPTNVVAVLSLSGGWCIKKVIRNPTPTPKPRRKTKQTKKRVEKKPKSGISFELVLLK